MFSGGERVQYTYSLGRMVKMVKRKIDHLIKYLLKLYVAKFFSCNNEQYSRQNLDTAINSGFD